MSDEITPAGAEPANGFGRLDDIDAAKAKHVRPTSKPILASVGEGRYDEAVIPLNRAILDALAGTHGTVQRASLVARSFAGLLRELVPEVLHLPFQRLDGVDGQVSVRVADGEVRVDPLVLGRELLESDRLYLLIKLDAEGVADREVGRKVQVYVGHDGSPSVGAVSDTASPSVGDVPGSSASPSGEPGTQSDEERFIDSMCRFAFGVGAQETAKLAGYEGKLPEWPSRAVSA